MNKNNCLLAKCFSICVKGDFIRHNFADIVSNLELYSFFGDYVFCVHGESDRHIHVVFKANKPMTVKSISEVLGIPELFIKPVYGESGFDDYVKYFAHEHEVKKC